jgi:hypothetical protein
VTALLRWLRWLSTLAIVGGAPASLAPGAAEAQLDQRAPLRLGFPMVPETDVGVVKQIVPASKEQGCELAGRGMIDEAAERIWQTEADAA